MTKRGASYADMAPVDLPDDPGPETVQPHDGMVVRSHGEPADAAPARPARASKPASRARAQKPRPAQVQRSIYATDATFDKIRSLAFNERRPIQEFYREALFLLMRKYKVDDGVKLDDV